MVTFLKGVAQKLLSELLQSCKEHTHTLLNTIAKIIKTAACPYNFWFNYHDTKVNNALMRTHREKKYYYANAMKSWTNWLKNCGLLIRLRLIKWTPELCTVLRACHSNFRIIAFFWTWLCFQLGASNYWIFALFEQLQMFLLFIFLPRFNII